MKNEKIYIIIYKNLMFQNQYIFDKILNYKLENILGLPKNTFLNVS